MSGVVAIPDIIRKLCLAPDCLGPLYKNAGRVIGGWLLRFCEGVCSCGFCEHYFIF